MVPWWNTLLLIERANQQLMKNKDNNQSSSSFLTTTSDIPILRMYPIKIEGIEDWCIDYTYANPSLWLIASSGVWYRVAGPLLIHPNPSRRKLSHQGFPTLKYESFFKNTRTTFLCCIHIAMVLLDFLPIIPKIGYSDVVAEVVARANKDIDECDILENYEMIDGKKYCSF